MLSKLVPVVGNVREDNVGIEAEAIDEIAGEVDIIVNSAANTTFDERSFPFSLLHIVIIVTLSFPTWVRLKEFYHLPLTLKKVMAKFSIYLIMEKRSLCMRMHLCVDEYKRD